MWDGFDSELLFGIQRQTCEENNVRVEVCGQLIKDDSIDLQHIRIFKPDVFFSSKNMVNPPKAIDCFVIVKNDNNEVVIWLIENRDINDMRHFKSAEIIEKFRTTIDWVGESFKEFLETMSIIQIKAWFVTSLYHDVSEDVWNKRLRDTSLAVFQSQKPLMLLGKPVMVEPLRSPQEICYWEKQ